MFFSAARARVSTAPVLDRHRRCSHKIGQGGMHRVANLDARFALQIIDRFAGEQRPAVALAAVGVVYDGCTPASDCSAPNTAQEIGYRP